MAGKWEKNENANGGSHSRQAHGSPQPPNQACNGKGRELIYYYVPGLINHWPGCRENNQKYFYKSISFEPIFYYYKNEKLKVLCFFC